LNKQRRQQRRQQSRLLTEIAARETMSQEEASSAVGHESEAQPVTDVADDGFAPEGSVPTSADFLAEATERISPEQFQQEGEVVTKDALQEAGLLDSHLHFVKRYNDQIASTFRFHLIAVILCSLLFLVVLPAFPLDGLLPPLGGGRTVIHSDPIATQNIPPAPEATHAPPTPAVDAIKATPPAKPLHAGGGAAIDPQAEVIGH
jgi:hypothetical protein